MIRPLLLALGLTAVVAQYASSQSASSQSALFVSRMGTDTMAIEQYMRTANRMRGDVIDRMGVSVTRTHYDVTLDAAGRVTSIVYRQRDGAGALLARTPVEVRMTMAGDSVVRTAVWPDSVQTRTYYGPSPSPGVNPAIGVHEVAFAQMRRNKDVTSTFSVAPPWGVFPAASVFTARGGDSISTTGITGTTVYHVDTEGRILSVDTYGTTQKLIATRENAIIDMDALARRTTPTGRLSGRSVARSSFLQSVIVIDYGQPRVRGRSVWGGALVPYDTLWRLGANEATHLATSRALVFGEVSVPPGMYTLWLFNARSGPLLVINKQIGQWGAGVGVYSDVNDLGRVPMQLVPIEHVEEFTITIENLGRRGSLQFAWGSLKAVAPFTVK